LTVRSVASAPIVHAPIVRSVLSDQTVRSVLSDQTVRSVASAPIVRSVLSDQTVRSAPTVPSGRSVRNDQIALTEQSVRRSKNQPCRIPSTSAHSSARCGPSCGR
jgi:hypothetical protein